MIGNAATPLSMLVIGSTLAMTPIREIWKGWRVYGFSIIRLLVVPSAVYLIFRNFIGNPLILGVVVLVTAMPSAATTVMFAEEYESNAKFAAQYVFITTLLAVLTIPIVGYLLFV